LERVVPAAQRLDLGNGDATLGRAILMKLDDDKRNVGFWHKADIEELQRKCPLLT
jgi:hypothetical protein